MVSRPSTCMGMCHYDVDVGLVMNFSSDYNWRLNAFNFLAADLAVRLGKCKYREDDMSLGYSRSGLLARPNQIKLA